MKKNITIYVIALYFMQCFTILSFLTVLKVIRNINPWFFLILGIVFGFISAVYGILNIINAILNDDYLKSIRITVMNKMILIPFYAINFVFSLLIISGFINPFLIVGVPILIIVLASITYITIVPTSIYNIIYIVKEELINQKRIKYSVIHIILHLIFIFDLIDSCVIYFKTRKILINETV